MNFFVRALVVLGILTGLGYSSYAFGKYVLSNKLFGPNGAKIHASVPGNNMGGGAALQSPQNVDVKIVPFDGPNKSDSQAAPAVHENNSGTDNTNEALPTATPYDERNSESRDVLNDSTSSTSEERPRKRRRRRHRHSSDESTNSRTEQSSNQASNSSAASSTDSNEPARRSNADESSSSSDNSNSDSPAPRAESPAPSSEEAPRHRERRKRHRIESNNDSRPAERVAPRSEPKSEPRSVIPVPEGEKPAGNDSPIPVPG